MSIPQEFKATSRLTYLVGSMGVDRQTYSTAHYESRRSAVCSRIRHCSVGKKERSKGYDAAIDCCYGLVGGKKRRRWGVQLRGEQVPWPTYLPTYLGMVLRKGRRGTRWGGRHNSTQLTSTHTVRGSASTKSVRSRLDMCDRSDRSDRSRGVGVRGGTRYVRSFVRSL